MDECIVVVVGGRYNACVAKEYCCQRYFHSGSGENKKKIVVFVGIVDGKSGSGGVYYFTCTSTRGGVSHINEINYKPQETNNSKCFKWTHRPLSPKSREMTS